MKVRTWIAVLLIISGVTHVIQLQVYGARFHVIGAVLFGVAYFAIGVRLLRPGRSPLWWGAILPSIGGGLGVIRFLELHANPFTVFHVLIDLIVMPTILWLGQSEKVFYGCKKSPLPGSG